MQEFNFIPDTDQEGLSRNRAVLNALVFPGSYWLDGYNVDEDEEGVDTIAITATYQFVDLSESNWSWVNVVFRKDGTAYIDFLYTHSMHKGAWMLTLTSKWLVAMGFNPIDEFEDMRKQELQTWQEGYDRLCEISQRLQTSVPEEA